MPGFTVPITLIGENGKTTELDVLVDPEVMFGVLPSSVLDKLGVKHFRTVERRGGFHQRMGQVEAELGGSAAYITCVFGDEDEPARLGSHNLDTLLLQVDPQRSRLVPKEFRLIQHF